MKLLIAVPCYGGLVSDKTCNSLFNLGKSLQRQGIDHNLITLANSSIITQGRSKLANVFMNVTDADYLLFIDSDIGFKSNHVLRLLNRKKHIVCGSYPKKTLPLEFTHVNTSEPPEMEGELVKIRGAGLGFTLIHRSVFEVMSEHYPELKYVPEDPQNDEEKENSYHYFSELKRNNAYLSEDMSFFHRAMEIGFDIWMDSTIHLSHVGSHVFSL